MNKSMGEVAFDAYNTAVGGKTWDGKPIPPWAEVSTKVKIGWQRAARAICSLPAGLPASDEQMALYDKLHDVAMVTMRRTGLNHVNGCLAIFSPAFVEKMGAIGLLIDTGISVRTALDLRYGTVKVIVSDLVPDDEFNIVTPEEWERVRAMLDARRADYEHNKLQREGSAS